MRRFDFPFFRRDSYAALPWIVAFMVFLSILFLSLAINLQTMSSHWQQDDSERITLHIPADVVDSVEVANHLARQLKTYPGITEIKSFTRDEVQQLLTPWLGEQMEATELPIPQLLEIRFDQDELDHQGLRRLIAETAPEAEVTEHQQWLEDFSRLVQSTKWLSHGIVTLILLLTLVIIIMSTQSELNLHRDTVELLRSLGATNPYIAHQFQASALWMTGKGTMAGAALAMVMLLIFHQLSAQLQAPFLPLMQFSLKHVFMLLFVVISTMALGMATARLTVLQRLREME